jgi:DNA-binding NarL/FixJ family response regulator
MEKINILIVDDHKLFREGLKMLLKNLEIVNEIWEAASGEEFLTKLNSQLPDLILMDIEMPGMNGVDATKQALDQHPDLKIIALSMYGDDEYFQKMIDAGACGFLLKNSDFSEVKKAVTNVIQGNNYFTEEMLYNLVNKFRSRQQNQAETDITLSDREKEILLLICKGLSNQEIAEKLYISKRTVDHHRASLMTKTKTNNAASLVVYAVKHKLVDI